MESDEQVFKFLPSLINEINLEPYEAYSSVINRCHSKRKIINCGKKEKNEICLPKNVKKKLSKKKMNKNNVFYHQINSNTTPTNQLDPKGSTFLVDSIDLRNKRNKKFEQNSLIKRSHNFLNSKRIMERTLPSSSVNIHNPTLKNEQLTNFGQINKLFYYNTPLLTNRYDSKVKKLNLKKLNYANLKNSNIKNTAQSERTYLEKAGRNEEKYPKAKNLCSIYYISKDITQNNSKFNFNKENISFNANNSLYNDNKININDEQKINFSQNLKNEIKEYKLKNVKLTAMLKKANYQIKQLKTVLNGYKRKDSKFFCADNNIEQRNERKRIIKKDMVSNDITKINNKNMNNFVVKTHLNNSKVHSCKILGRNDASKYIYSLYCPKDALTKSVIICFDSESKKFKKKYIKDYQFYKDLNEVSNNKVNRNIFLIDKDEYYIITGANFNKFYVYNYITNNIKKLSELKYNHSNGNMLKYKNYIIALGGNFSKSAEIYLKEKNRWISLPKMLVERSHFTSCIVKDKYIFIFFGYNYSMKKYINTIEYFDIDSYINNSDDSQYFHFWKLLKYNYFNYYSPLKQINLVGAIAVNYYDEKILFLGGKKGELDEDKDSYYQLIINENILNTNNIEGYIENINLPNDKNFSIFYNFDYKFIEGINHDNVMNEPAFVAFDNKYNAHLIKLNTMNHEIYKYN